MANEHEFITHAFCRACGLRKDLDGKEGLCLRCQAEPRRLSEWIKVVGEDDWEEGGSVRQLVAALPGTLADVLFRPGRFFGELGFEPSNLPALLYGAALGTLGLAGLLVSLWLVGLIPLRIPVFELLVAVLSFLLFMGPFLIVALGTLGYAIVPRLLGRRNVTDATLRIFAYSFGSTWLFLWVPIAGIPVALTWAHVASFFGFRRLMKLSRAEALLATLAPVAVLALLVGGFAVR